MILQVQFLYQVNTAKLLWKHLNFLDNSDFIVTGTNHHKAWFWSSICVHLFLLK